MNENVSIITINYDPIRVSGRLIHSVVGKKSSIWERLRAHVIADQTAITLTEEYIELAWPDVLAIVREYGSKSAQSSLCFRFRPEGEALARIKEFSIEVKQTRLSRNELRVSLDAKQIKEKLELSGFSFAKRDLRPFQLRDLQHLLALPHGANFSVPGAGKTTVTFALHLLVREQGQHLFVVCPKAAFPAWQSIVRECMDDDATGSSAEPFTLLDGKQEETEALLRSGATRFIMSYDLLVRQQSVVSAYFASNQVHLVLDESHRMKAGWASQRGAFLLNIASLPVRRDILSGTPMPQGASDLASQLGFLWPGHGLDIQIQRGVAPKEVLGQLYVRTTKQELGLPPVNRYYPSVDMAPGQLALYSVVRDEALRQLVSVIKAGKSNPDYLSARRSVMRLLQLSVNPTLALRSMAGDAIYLDSGIVDKVIEEGASSKVRAVTDHVRQLAKEGKKTVVWTIFTQTIRELEDMLVDINPVSIYGAIPSGDCGDLTTREGRLKRFHEDDACQVLIANPAAAGEGISLHQVCHDAIYLDRSYVSTHYLQSIDRVHRLGLAPDVETNIHIYETKAPPSLGSIDLSVRRRLATKIRNLQQLLDDPDLHKIAFDEENAGDPVDYDVDLQDLIDLVEELEGKATSPGIEADE